MLNFNIKFVKSTKKQATTNMSFLKKIAIELQWARWKFTVAPILKKYYYFNACGGKGGLCSCFLLF